MKVIFMGTSKFAVPALNAISNSGHELVAVFTKQPKKAGRDYQIHKSFVHIAAERIGTKIYTPKNLKSEDIRTEIKNLEADAIVVAAYGHILPVPILEIPRYGCINIHPSLLPRWRGAAPIERTILAGDEETAVCIMHMDAGLDTGDILSCKKVSVSERETSESLTATLAKLGSEMLVEVLNNINSFTPIKQSSDGVTYADKLAKIEAEISWGLSAEKIGRMVRALNPWPGCYFNFDNEHIKVCEATLGEEKEQNKAQNVPGTLLDKDFNVRCGDGSVLKLLKLQRPGKKILSAKDLLNGLRLKPGSIL